MMVAENINFDYRAQKRSERKFEIDWEEKTLATNYEKGEEQNDWLQVRFFFFVLGKKRKRERR